ncbi:MAG: NUDIX hydrolase [Candidatus Arcticimaribacter sp.]|nr:NUDIX domain-containing protein [Flavobacteriaceae bacterium]PSR10518.1 MAG: NUDIX hydrolase [Candidatus Arcticimaribacter sp.]PTM00237.1 MAG: NUDIX hydrolase [Candidatus Arcticimaribacter sp.]
MYKVFFNQKPIFLTTELVHQTDRTPVLFIKFSSPENIIKALKSKKTDCLYLYHQKEDKLWMHFLRHFPIVEAAGGLVRHQDGRFLFIYRNDKWDLPKGRIEKNEPIRIAAVREVEEETGVDGLEIVKPLIETFHVFNRNGKYKLKKTFWFEMKTASTVILTPQLNEGIEQAVWVFEKEIPHKFENAYENIKQVYESL